MAECSAKMAFVKLLSHAKLVPATKAAQLGRSVILVKLVLQFALLIQDAASKNHVQLVMLATIALADLKAKVELVEQHLGHVLIQSPVH